jgi:hypothetical protein
MMLGQMIAGETGLLDPLDQPQALIEEAAQWRAVRIEMVEDSKSQHALFSMTE